MKNYRTGEHRKDENRKGFVKRDTKKDLGERLNPKNVRKKGIEKKGRAA